MNQPKVSIIYCTARPGGLDILENCTANQTHQNFEVIIVDELHRVLPSHLLAQFKVVDPPHKKDNMFWNLSASLNAGVRAASGDLIILLQDYIWVPSTGIEKFISRYHEEGPKCLITGVSDQYQEPSKIDDPNGQYSVWSHFPGPPTGEKTFSDPRKEWQGFYVTNPIQWEANWGMFPKQAWLDVGGFDERYDAGWGYDNTDFADRCQHAGYRIFLDTTNEVLCYSHINLFKEQSRRDAAPNNLALYNRLERDRHKKFESWKLNYC